MSEYIRGWRQVEAIWIIFRYGLLRLNWPCVKRELHIMTGFAKPYKIVFTQSFKDSHKDLFGEEFDEEEFRAREVER